MSYMRGPTYVWSDGVRLHIWDENGGNDGWLESGWNHDAKPNAGGVSVDLDTFEELCAMFWSRMTVRQRRRAVKRAARKYGGNVGAEAVVMLTGRAA